MELRDNVIIFDANIWIAYFSDQDSLSDQAVDYVESIPEGQSNVIMTDFLIQEIITVFLYKNQMNSIKNFLKFLDKEQLIVTVGIDTELFKELIEFIKSHLFKPRLSLTDWSLLFLAQSFNFELITFDKQLNNTHLKLTRQAGHI